MNATRDARPLASGDGWRLTRSPLRPRSPRWRPIAASPSRTLPLPRPAVSPLSARCQCQPRQELARCGPSRPSPICRPRPLRPRRPSLALDRRRRPGRALPAGPAAPWWQRSTPPAGLAIAARRRAGLQNRRRARPSSSPLALFYSPLFGPNFSSTARTFRPLPPAIPRVSAFPASRCVGGLFPL